MAATSLPKPHTFVYKTAKGRRNEEDGVKIALDVYLPQSKHDNPPRPLIWIHTGGFLQGSRRFLPHVSVSVSRTILGFAETTFTALRSRV